MANDKEKRVNPINNIGRYVIKVGDVFVGSYQRKFPSMFKNFPNKVVSRLSDVQEVIHDKDQAMTIAKTVHGKVYQVCVEPVEDSQ